jgi:hypothetical protein
MMMKSWSKHSRVSCARDLVEIAVLLSERPTTKLPLPPDEVASHILDRPLGAHRRRVPFLSRGCPEHVFEPILSASVVVVRVHAGVPPCISDMRRINSAGGTSSIWLLTVQPWPNGSMMKPSRSP